MLTELDHIKASLLNNRRYERLLENYAWLADDDNFDAICKLVCERHARALREQVRHDYTWLDATKEDIEKSVPDIIRELREDMATFESNPWERTLYRVKHDHSVLVMGWLEARDNNMPGFESDPYPRYTFVTGDWPPLTKPLTVPIVEWASSRQQYNRDLHAVNVPLFFDSQRAEHRPLYLADTAVPGVYWCLDDEEVRPKEG